MDKLCRDVANLIGPNSNEQLVPENDKLALAEIIYTSLSCVYLPELCFASKWL